MYYPQRRIEKTKRHHERTPENQPEQQYEGLPPPNEKRDELLSKFDNLLCSMDFVLKECEIIVEPDK